MSESNRGVTFVTCEYIPFPGGIATYVSGLLNATKQRTSMTSVIAPQYAHLSDASADESVYRYLKHHEIGLSAGLRSLALIRRLPADDILVAADVRAVLFLYCSKFIHRRSYRSMVHGSEAAKFKKRSPIFWLVRKAYIHSERVMYNSRATRNIFVDAFGAPKEEIVTYLGVDQQWFTNESAFFEHEKLIALPDKTKIICSVGRLERRKGHLETIRALGRARKYLGDFVYVIAGRPEEDTYVREIETEAQRLEVPVIVTGRLEQADIKRLYSRAVINLLFAQPLSGKVEGFGLVLLEAAAQGCPTIGSNTGGIPEVLDECGILVEHDDLDELAHQIIRVYSDRELRRNLSMASIERARSFTWERCSRLSFPELYVQS